MCSCGLTLKRWFFIFLFISLALIISGLIFIIYGAMNYESVREELQYKRSYRTGAVVDAGGSATRLTMFTMNEDSGKMKMMFGKPFQCEDNGIDSYAPKMFDELKQKMTSCLDKPFFANGIIPGDKKIPLFFGATGGMRLLRIQNETNYNATMSLMKEVLDNSRFKVQVMKVLSGTDEGFMTWNAANFMKDEQYRKGIIEFGSSSLQFVFEPDQKIGDNHPNVIPIDTKDGKRLLYRQTYPCFGGVEAERRINAFLIKTKPINDSSMVLDNPCLFNGYETNVTADEIYQSPCVSGEYANDALGESFKKPINKTIFTIKGSSNQSACSNLFGMVYNSECSSESPQCGFNKVFQPSVSSVKFLGLSTLYYTARYMKLPSITNLTQYRQKRDQICALNWDQLEEEIYAPRRCFDASYTYWVLTQGLKFSGDTNQIQFTQKNEAGTNFINWSFGWAQQERDTFYKSQGYPYRFTIITRSPNYLILIAIGVVFLLIGAVLITCAIKAKRSDRHPVKTADEEMY